MLPFHEELRKIPLALIAIPFILGIVVQENIPVHYWVLISTTILILTFLYSFVFIKANLLSHPFLFLLIIVLSFSLGAFNTQRMQQKEKPDSNIFTSDAFIASIQDIPYIKSNKTNALLKIEYTKNNKHWRKTELLCQSIILDTAQEIYKTGQRFYVNSKLVKPQTPIIPGQFNYANFLHYKGIYLQSFIQSNEIKPITGGNNSIYVKINLFRESLLRKINNGSLGAREESIISAFILGYTKNIDAELNQAYINAGASHILSVSGMHVGLVFMYLSLILKNFNRNRKIRIAKSIIIIILLWFYAVLAGMSSPVMRAALMFSFFALAEISNRKISSINIIACSALVILVINPYYLFDLGFQLSYAAMLGIILVYIPISHRWLPKNTFLKNSYQLILLSLAAQIATLPLILYYFQQFPTYFLLANLIIVPLAGIILYGTIVYSILLPIPFIANLLVYPVKYSIWLLNTAVLEVEDLPGKLIRNPALDAFLLFLISAAIICFLFGLVRKNYKAIPAFLFMLLLTLFYLQILTIQKQKHTLVRTFIIDNHKVLNISQGNINLFIANQEIEKKIGVKNSYFLKLDQHQIHFIENNIIVEKINNSRIYITTPQSFIILSIANSKNPVQRMIVLNKNYQIIGNEDFSNNKFKEYSL